MCASIKLNVRRNQIRDVMISKKVDNGQYAFNVLGPLNTLLKIFSLNCNLQINTSLDNFCILFKYALTVTVLGVINFFTLYYKVINVYSQINASIKFTDLVQMVFDYFQYLVDVYNAYKYGRNVSIEYYKQYGNIDKILGVTNYPAIKKRIMKSIVFFLFSWFITSACDFAAWVLSFGWLTPIMYSVAYIFLLIKILTTLDLSAHAMQIECRLRSICDLLQHKYASLEPLPGVESDLLNNLNWFYSDACSRVNKLLTKKNLIIKPLCSSDHEVKWLCRCYLMLIEQSTFINNMFGIRFLLNSLSLLIDMIRFLNLAVRMLIGSQHTTYDAGYFPAVCSLLRLLMCVVILVNLVDNCEKVHRQTDNILNIADHILINRQPDEELRDTVTELRDLIRSRPIYFNIANFFRLNYSMLLSVASVVVTYTIILLQTIN
ncbi:uncharacterized protein LOC113520791 [Galleria mellonella]|uniref:Gustatory receptor n=1 Tax=Galleria mellonella TaxID=7137 RepID=A0A6J1WZQ2_GALME|nr:uncharacterized protein LOC113520791 [Galleria mellonella]